LRRRKRRDSSRTAVAGLQLRFHPSLEIILKIAESSIRGRLFHVFDHYEIHRSLSFFELQAEFIAQRGEFAMVASSPRVRPWRMGIA
jgi:hypothetical protein